MWTGNGAGSSTNSARQGLGLQPSEPFSTRMTSPSLTESLNNVGLPFTVSCPDCPCEPARNLRSPLILRVMPRPGRPLRLRASMPAASRASPMVRPPRLNRRSGWPLRVTLRKFNVSAPASFRIPSGVTASGVQKSALTPCTSSMVSGRLTATRSFGISMIWANISGRSGVNAPPPTNRIAWGTALFNCMI